MVMRTFMNKVVDGKMGARHTDSVLVVLKQTLEDTLGGTPALWVQYHYRLDVIKVFIRNK